MLPGALLVGLVVLLRLSGVLQVQELMAFDMFSHFCPAMGFPQRVVIVGIDEADLRMVGGFPVPDRELAKALQILWQYKPSAIGLDIFRNLPVEPGHDQLVRAFKTIPVLVGAEVALNPDDRMNIQPPPALPLERVGFADVIVELDGKLRRNILASRTWDGDLKYSLAIRLAQLHLAARGIPFQPIQRSRDPIRFGNVQLPRFEPNTGGYVGADANGNQILINFCKGQKPFPVLSLQQLFRQQFPPDLIRDHMVILGMTASSVKDVFFTSALRETIMSQSFEGQPLPNQLIYGVEFHAHATNQIVSAVLDGQPLLRSWADFWEYVWIVAWGMVGVVLGIAFQSPWKSLLGLAIASLNLLLISYGLLIFGWWIPVVPTGLALCGAGLVTSFFDRDLRFELEQRRCTIESTYEAVHNGPLQQLAAILRNMREQDPDELEHQLRSLNNELRSIFEYMRREATAQSDRLYLGGEVVLDLRDPLPELLYQVYDYTLAEPMPVFAGIKHFIPPNFQLLQGESFSPARKRLLCLFLQEALHNAGKHALGATRLQVTCTIVKDWYSLRVMDNGIGIAPNSNQSREGQGTRQAREIAREMKGWFRRYPHSPQGTVCELTWRMGGGWLRRLWHSRPNTH